MRRRELLVSNKSTSSKYLTFVALESGTFKFTDNRTSGTKNSIMYSLNDGITWTTLSSGTNSPTVAANKTIMWKGECTPAIGDQYLRNTAGIGVFSSTGNFTVEGNVMSLLYGDNFSNQTTLDGKDYAFNALFYGCQKLVSIENINLPATTLSKFCYGGMFYRCGLTTIPSDLLPARTLSQSCYHSMFSYCESLIQIPSKLLPATTLAEQCYDSMFNYCTSLTTVPSGLLPATNLSGGDSCYAHFFGHCTSLTTVPNDLLPATTLANYCYWQMFMSCPSLTVAPELPATQLQRACYGRMLTGCTSLTVAPELPATTLVERCYEYMFDSSTNLNYIKAMFTTTPNGQDGSYTYGWLRGVNANGIFIKNPEATWSETGDYAVPSNWAIAKYDYDNFTPTTTFTPQGYVTFTANKPSGIGLSVKNANHTFYISKNGTDWMGLNTNLGYLFDENQTYYVCGTLVGNNGTSLYSTFAIGGSVDVGGNIKAIWNYSDLNADFPSYAGYRLFAFCSGLNSVSNNLLPSTTLAGRCYHSMFLNCTSLTVAPELPATTLVTQCYEQMFYNCTKLNYIKAMFTTTPSDTYTKYWVNGVAASGTFVKNSAASWSVTGTNGVPSGWTVQTASS